MNTVGWLFSSVIDMGNRFLFEADYRALVTNEDQEGLEKALNGRGLTAELGIELLGMSQDNSMRTLLLSYYPDQPDDIAILRNYLCPLHLNLEMAEEIMSPNFAPAVQDCLVDAVVSYDRDCIDGFTTPLLTASEEGYPKIAAACIRLGDVGLSRKDRGENTSLHLACREGHSEIVAMLLKNGALEVSECGEQKTPLELAYEREDDAVLEAWASSGVKASNPMVHGSENTLLHAAYTSENLARTMLLLEILPLEHEAVRRDAVHWLGYHRNNWDDLSENGKLIYWKLREKYGYPDGL